MRSHILPFLLAIPPLCAQESKPAPWQLGPDELAAGWTVLFDGTSTDAWRGYRNQAVPAQGWVVRDGTLLHEKGGGGGDLITRRQFGDFELELQFKIGAGANSGILYRVTEAEEASYWTGPEFQLIDDSEPSVGRDSVHSTGALYDLYKPHDKAVADATSWQSARIVVHSGRIEHWLNGHEIVEAQLGSDDWNERIAKSKFAKWKGFAKAARGAICLQDHGDEVAFRKIKIRELPPGPERLGDEIVLFDGKDLAQWTCHLPAGSKLEDVWSIQDGELVCKGQPIGYLYTKQKYTSYLLHVQWRFDPAKGAGNSGVLLRVNGQHKVWPRSIEAQLESGNAGDFWNIDHFGMQVDPARTKGRNTKTTQGAEKPLGEWNQYEIIVDGPWVRLSVNGKVLNEAWDCEVIPGFIALQSEGAEIHFRDIRLVPLKPQ